MKSFFLKGVLAIYIVAFTSLYIQVQSLFGDNGVVPLRDFLSRGGAATKGPLDSYNIISLAPKIGLSYGTFVELLCLLGVIVAFSSLWARRLMNALSFGFLWYVYYSICSVGQGFMSFHSDLLLLEVGFISVLLAPLLPSAKLSQSDHDHMSFFLVKWLVFRYFVTNVFNVYLDNDKAWYSMTAIPMVAQGVQFPSQFSWHIFNLAPETIKLYQAYEHAVKLCTPFLFLFDFKYCRLLAFYTMLFVAVPSALFFNFGWTDLLISVCLVSYLKDAYFHSDKRAKQSGIRTLLDITVLLAYISAVATILIKFYGVKYENGVVKTQVLFTPSQFKLLVDHLVPIALVLGILGLLSSAYTSFFNSSKKTSLVKTTFYTSIVVALFFSTFPTLTRFSPGLDQKVKLQTVTKELSRFAAPYMLSNNYLLLSKVSEHYADGRPELQLQGRESAEDPTWQQFDLRYKPGNPSREVARVVPHLPRVDLKMWYAARSSLQNNQWIQTLAYRVATNEKDVVSALSPTNPKIKINQMRVVMQKYKHSSKTRIPFAGYWAQHKFVSEYMPTTSVDNLRFSVKSNGINLTPPTKTGSKASSVDKLLNEYLEIASAYIRGIDHSTIIWTLTAVAAASMLK